MGKLDATQWEDWSRVRVAYLERVIRLNLNQINTVCRAVHASARRGNLKPSWTAYVTARRHAVPDFDRRLAEIRAAHAKMRALIERLVEKGL